MPTVSQKPVAPSLVVVSAPMWWTRWHSAVLATIVIANVHLDCLAPQLMEQGGSRGLVLGHWLAQLFLMGLWLALGGLHFIIRFAFVTLTTLAGVLACSGIDDSLQELLVVVGMIVLGTQAIVVPLRWLLGWRIDFDRAYHATSKYRSFQFALIHVLGLTTILALQFALARCFPKSTHENIKLFPLTLGATGLIGAFPIAMFMVAARRRWVWGLITAVVLPSASYVESVTFGPTLGFGDDLMLMWFANVGIAVTVLFNLGVLRLAGLRLFSVKAAESSVKQASEGGMVVADPRRQSRFGLRPAFVITFVISVGIVAFLPRLRTDIEGWFGLYRGGIPRLAILGPVTSGGPPTALPPPTKDEVVRLLRRQGILDETKAEDVAVVLKPIHDWVDPPRDYPLIGRAHVHHALYGCIVTDAATAEHSSANPPVLVDYNHFHLVDDGSQSIGR